MQSYRSVSEKEPKRETSGAVRCRPPLLSREKATLRRTKNGSPVGAAAMHEAPLLLKLSASSPDRLRSGVHIFDFLPSSCNAVSIHIYHCRLVQARALPFLCTSCTRAGEDSPFFGAAAAQRIYHHIRRRRILPLQYKLTPSAMHKI